MPIPTAMIAAAAVTDNVKDIILAGLGEVPETSRLYEDVMSVISMYEEGKTWEDVTKYIHEKWDEHTVHGWCHTISNAMICAMALLYGEGDFTVGIRDPKGNSSSIISIKTESTCVSTSGSYEQQFEANGKNYHHILDPETGYPVDNGLLSVTIVSDSGILSDALSTACFVLGYEKGKALAETYGCGIIFVTEDKKVYAENGAENYIEITDNEYTLVVQ